MIGGVLPFLIQWLAISQFGSVLLNPNPSLYSSYLAQNLGQGPTAQYSNARYSPHRQPTQWTLLNEFDSLPEDEIERYLPQVCNILLDYETMNDPRLMQQYEQMIINKCANCLPFGIKVCSYLKASSQSPSEGLFKNLFSTSSASQDRQDRLRYIQAKVEAATSYGSNIASKTSQLRCEYYRDMVFMMDSLARLGTELKSYSHTDRNHHLRIAISQLNSLLYHRMLNKADISSESNQPSMHYQSADHMSFSTESFYNSKSAQAYPQSELKVAPKYQPTYSTRPSRHIVKRQALNSHLNVVESAHSDDAPSAAAVSASVDDRTLLQGQGYQTPFISTANVLRFMPVAAKHSLHFPLLRCQDKVQKIIRFVESECEVMPSRDRAPYLVIVELLEQPYLCQSADLFGSAIPPLQSITSAPHIARGIDEPTLSAKNLPSTNHDSQMKPVSPSNSLKSVEEILEDIRGGSSHWNQPRQTQWSNLDSTTQRGVHGPYQNDVRPSMAGPYSPVPRRISFNKAQTWAEKKDMIKGTSPFGHLPGYTIRSFLVKSGDDLRKEVLAMQLLEFISDVLRIEGIDVHLRPYQIISTGYQAGLVEFLDGATSIDRIKKSASSSQGTLKDYFEYTFGPSYSLFYATAVENFVKSLAGYSLLTYVLQVKDRHNANLLIDPEGHIIHIDYGFILGDSPGFNINFENAPFKLTKEYIELIGGIDSSAFKQFEDLFVRGFFAIQKHIDGLIAIIQLFYGDDKRGVSDALKARLMFASSHADVLSLIRDSLESWRTKQYDLFQQRSNNIAM